MRFTRITVDPAQMGGVPCIRGLRIPVATVVGMVADGIPEDQILKDYPDLEREDIREALRYAFQRHSYWRPTRGGGEDNYRGIFRRNFHVLRNFEMPCVLVEAGFVTHPQECQLLVNPEFQNLIARNIRDGIIVFQNSRVREQAARGGV